MFRLLMIVRRGSASSLPATWVDHASLAEARAAAVVALRAERVQRVAIVRGVGLGEFVEWCER